MKTVSVVIPTYNSRQLVVEAVESVLAQTRPAIETIVVDDGSTDDTEAGLRPHEDRIRYIAQGNRGRAAARNRAIRLAIGDFVAFLDADDVWYPHKLEVQMEAISRHPGASWAYCQTRLVDERGSLLESAFWPTTFGSGRVGAHEVLTDLLTGRIEISTSTVVVDRESVVAVGLFDESLRSGEDTHLWIRLAQATGPLLYTPAELATRRVNTQTSFLGRIADYGYAETWHRVLDSSLSGPSYGPEVRALAQSASSDAYLDSAFLELVQGELQAARRYWREAYSCSDAGLFGATVANRLATFALSAARYHYAGPREAERIVREVASQLPELGWTDHRTQRVALGHLFAAIAHMFNLKRNKPAAARYARWAIVKNPHLVWNIGLLKTALEMNSVERAQS